MIFELKMVGLFSLVMLFEFSLSFTVGHETIREGMNHLSHVILLISDLRENIYCRRHQGPQLLHSAEISTLGKPGEAVLEEALL